MLSRNSVTVAMISGGGASSYSIVICVTINSFKTTLMLFVDSEAITTVVSVGGEISTHYLVLMMTACGYESVVCIL